MRAEWALTALVAAVALGTSACGSNSCGDADETNSGTAPRVENLRLSNQLEGDPSTLVFGARFTDADGDLRNGQALFHLNGSGSPNVTFPLADIYRQSALPDGAMGGELALTLRLVADVRDGQTLEIGLRLQDEAEQTSNCFPLEIEFSVASAAQTLEENATELLASVWPWSH